VEVLSASAAHGPAATTRPARRRAVASARLLIGLLAALLPPAEATAATGAERLVAAAAAQIGVTTRYDGRYVRLAYPGGDVEADRGVCTDVLVRAYRMIGVDLQVEVHEDMRRAWDAYPKIWGLTRPDRSIDHRRVPNLQVFLGRHGEQLPPSEDPAAYRPGDIVSWTLPSGLPHIGLVAAAPVPTERPWVIHNIGAGVQHEDVLFEYRITGHYRYLPR